MGKPLVIVESPAKARTISRYLGDGYEVASSIGHVRDLPSKAADLPPAHRKRKWEVLGVDVDNDFKPLYVVSAEKKEQVKHLRELVQEADELYLATDEDREGESIAWHLLEVLKPRAEARRMVFHEITPEAIQAALTNTRPLDRRLVDAQEARRVLDRIFGYTVSPVLWKKVLPQLSAGRVQSVATRIVVERERERVSFVSAGFWDITGSFASASGSDAEPGFSAISTSVDGRRVASSRDFGADGSAAREDLVVLDEAAARGLVDDLAGVAFAVRTVERKPYRRRPAAPFITSTLQQEAGRKLRMTAAQAMSTAQALYEHGFITYMRTDSTTLSQTAEQAARGEIAERYGAEYLPDSPRRYAKKVRNAQEAHEAIRPAGDRFKDPGEVAGQVSPAQAKLYDLIWKRTIASQMTDAVGETVTIRLGAVAADSRDVEFATRGTIITHDGFRRAYVENTDNEDAGTNPEDVRLPAMAEGDRLTVLGLEAAGHATQPPPRYTEASLVKRLEELGVGRPSTYASIMGTIQDRGYVWKRGPALIPAYKAFAVVTLLENHFPDLVDYAFTARMEEDLDSIAGGRLGPVPWLHRLYFGNGEPGLKSMVSERLNEIDARAVNSIPVGTDEEGRLIVVRVGRFGPYLERGEDTASVPEGVAPDELTVALATELLAAPKSERELGVDPDSGLKVLVRSGSYGPYVQLGEATKDKKKRPKTASLFKSMEPQTVTLEQALELLSFPRVVGEDPADGLEITVQNGKHGPWLKKGSDTRSLESEEKLLTITLEQCLELLAAPKQRRGRRSAEPLRELGVDPVSGNKMVVKDGSFGPYVTDGETNASLRKDDKVDAITDERASELLQLRRDRGPSQRVLKRAASARKKAPAKKAASKPAIKKAAKKTAKTGSKKTAKKAAVKKAAGPATP